MEENGEELEPHYFGFSLVYLLIKMKKGKNEREWNTACALAQIAREAYKTT